MANVVKVAGAMICMTLLSGCTGLSHLMYNYMCDPYGHGQCWGQQCSADCQHPHAVGMMPPAHQSPPVLTPTSAEIAAPAASEEVVMLQKQVESLNSTVREKLAELDRRSNDQKSDNEHIVEVMGKVAENLRSVSDRLDEKEVEFADIAARVEQQRNRRDSELTAVEQELNELLSRFDTNAN